MRQITKKAVDALMNNQTFLLSNTDVRETPHYTVLALHGNDIAQKNRETGEMLVRTASKQANKPTVITKERLNGIPGVVVYSKEGQLYLNEKKWDGGWTKIV